MLRHFSIFVASDIESKVPINLGSVNAIAVLGAEESGAGLILRSPAQGVPLSTD